MNSSDWSEQRYHKHRREMLELRDQSLSETEMEVYPIEPSGVERYRHVLLSYHPWPSIPMQKDSR